MCYANIALKIVVFLKKKWIFKYYQVHHLYFPCVFDCFNRIWVAPGYNDGVQPKVVFGSITNLAQPNWGKGLAEWRNRSLAKTRNLWAEEIPVGTPRQLHTPFNLSSYLCIVEPSILCNILRYAPIFFPSCIAHIYYQCIVDLILWIRFLYGSCFRSIVTFL